MSRREMHFGVFVLGTGNHSAGWRYEGAATSNNDLAVIQEIARQAERGKFDLVFVSDGLIMDPGDHPSFLCRFEPTTLISALSLTTTHIGLGATVSTTFGEPYHVARTFASIDNISRGRAAWNVVTSSAGRAALNFSREEHMEHDLRYERAQEFVDVVKGLWDCWEDGAVVADKATGIYLDRTKVRPLDHKGRFFQVKGPINTARCPQGHPVIIQAGGSDAGLELAARTADVVFSVVQELASAKTAYRDLKTRMAKYGRTPDQIAVLPGVMPIIGSTEAEARDKLSRLQSWLTPTNALTLVTSRIGYDVTGFPLDGPVPAPPPGEGSHAFSRVLYEYAHTREHDPARSLQPDRGGPRSLGAVRHAEAHRRHAGGMVRGGSGGRLQRPAAVLPRRARRLRRSRRAGAPGARAVPARVRGHDAARPLRAAARAGADRPMTSVA